MRSLCVVAVLMMVCGVAVAEDKVELKLDLPKAMFIGTPTDIKTDNLDPKSGTPRGPFYVPKGTTLMSLEKEVTGSDNEPVIGEMEQLTDGDKEAADGSYVEFGPGKQWVQIDLKTNVQIAAVVLWHYHSQARVYRDVIVQVADDPDFITNVRTIFNNDHDNSSGLGIGKDREYIETNSGQLIDGKGEKARYVRLWSNGNTSNEMNHYIEIEVYGQEAK